MNDPVEELLWETRRLFRELGVAADTALEAHGIQASERALLEFLARETAPVSISELARKYSVSRQHIHQSLQRMRNPDWIERLPDKDDARSVLLRLSDGGRSFWKQVRTVDQRILRSIGRRVDRAAIQKASRTLRQIRQLLEESKS
jgi:DNA-binding MarR family transcriptional regulator